MVMDQISSRKRDIVLLVVIVITSGIVLMVINTEIFHPPGPRMSITKINETGVPNGEIVPLTEEDFNEYPFLAPVIRDHSRQGTPYKNGTRIGYSVGLSRAEYDNIRWSNFFSWSPVFFEYQGNFYSFGLKFGDRNLTITKWNGSTPNGKIIRLTEDDFKEFPYLAPVIRNDSQEGVSYKNGTRIEYYVEISLAENEKIRGSKLNSEGTKFFEYNDTYYAFDQPEIP